MIEKIDRGANRLRFVLQPNCSASWMQILVFFAVVVAVSLGVAVAFALQGYWPVLPFAGAELALLGVCLWSSASRSATTEVVDIDADTVAVARGRKAPEQRWSFKRAWAQIRLVPAPVRMHPSRLLIGSHGRLVHLGSFLSEHERLVLASDLRQALATPPAAPIE